MGINPAQFLLLVLVGWTTIGIVGVLLSMFHGEQRKAFRNASWIAGIWTVYLAVLLGVSFLQPQKVLPTGAPQCFHDLCYTVVSTERLPGHSTDDNQLVRMTIDISNRGDQMQQETRIHAFLIDQTGRRWNEIPGLNGIPLTTRIPPGRSLTSVPVFKLPREATPVGIGFVHSRPYVGTLVIGDQESLFHQLRYARLAP